MTALATNIIGSRCRSSSGQEDIAEAKKITRGRAGVMAKIEKPRP